MMFWWKILERLKKLWYFWPFSVLVKSRKTMAFFFLILLELGWLEWVSDGFDCWHLGLLEAGLEHGRNGLTGLLEAAGLRAELRNGWDGSGSAAGSRATWSREDGLGPGASEMGFRCWASMCWRGLDLFPSKIPVFFVVFLFLFFPFCQKYHFLQNKIK